VSLSKSVTNAIVLSDYDDFLKKIFLYAENERFKDLEITTDEALYFLGDIMSILTLARYFGIETNNEDNGLKELFVGHDVVVMISATKACIDNLQEEDGF